MAGSDYYDHTTYPSQGAVGSSSAARAEFELIEAGFGKLPAFTGNGGKLLAVNAGETAQEALTAAQALAAIGAQATSGKDASGGYAGLTLFKLNLKNAAGTITSWFTTAATAARTWTMPDKDGTVAMTSDFAAPGPIGGTTPAAGAFTTVSATGGSVGDLTLNGGVAAPDGAIVRMKKGGVDKGFIAHQSTLVGDSSNNIGIYPVAGANAVLCADGSTTPTAVASATGLAVTGVLSATGDMSAQKSIGYGASANIGLVVGGTDNGAVNNGAASHWRQWVSGNENGQSLAIQAFVRGTGYVDKLTLDTSGNLLVGQTAVRTVNSNSFDLNKTDGALYTNHLSGTPTGYLYAAYGYNATNIGSITQNGTTAVAYNTTSDRRLKTNIRPADAARFMDIEFKDYEWTDGRHDCGPIADQLQLVYPSLVIGEKDAVEVRQVEITPAVPAVLDEEGNEVTPAVPAVTEDQVFPVYQQVNYPGLIGRMGTRVQQLQRTVDAQALLIAAMEARLAALEAT